VIRDGRAEDADAIARIYAHYVRTSLATFEEEPPQSAEMRRRIENVQRAGLPWRVTADITGTVTAYAYATLYRTRSAYRYTLENSVYVAADHHREGLGSALMRDVIDRCAQLGYRQMLAVIGDSANAASIGLHERLGFRLIAVHPDIGFKFGRWVDVVHMQLALGDGASSAPTS
jgi:L-amino acid N-acyltransferase YncA